MEEMQSNLNDMMQNKVEMRIEINEYKEQLAKYEEIMKKRVGGVNEN